MRIGLVTDGNIENFMNRMESGLPCSKDWEAELFVFAFQESVRVSYEKELKGESCFFEQAAKFSKKTKSVVVSGCVTDTCGHKRKSALVAQQGKLLGVSDMIHAVDGEVGSGASLRVYDTKIGRMGVAVAEDLIFPEVIRSLAVCGSDFIVCPFGKVGQMQSVLLRANAYSYGVPIVFCGEGYAMIAEASVEITYALPDCGVVELKNKKEYHLVETRRRGVWGNFVF
jgi:hypothetical protein